MVLESRIRTLDVRRLLTLVALVTLMAGMMGGAQRPRSQGWNCPTDAPATPDDDFVSGGIGLTCDEWVALYGPPADIGQDSVIFEIAGITVHWRPSNDIRLLLTTTPGSRTAPSPTRSRRRSASCRRTPSTWDWPISPLASAPYQTALVYHSPSLAERNATMGRPGLGYILMVISH